MKIIDFGTGPCARIRRYLDSYLSNELLVETNHEVLKHLESCAECTQALKARSRVRELLRRAMRSEVAPPALRSKIQKRIRAEGIPPHRSSWWQWGVAIAALLVLTMTTWSALRLWDQRQARIAAMLEIGLGDHVHCALGRAYRKEPPSLDEIAKHMGPDYVTMAQLAEEKIPGYKVVEGHRCGYQHRRFYHVILKKGSSLLSVILTRKKPGESYPLDWAARVLRAPGLDLHGAKLRGFAVAGFETRDHLAFVASDLSQSGNMQIATDLLPAMEDWLGRLESRAAAEAVFGTRPPVAAVHL